MTLKQNKGYERFKLIKYLRQFDSDLKFNDLRKKSFIDLEKMYVEKVTNPYINIRNLFFKDGVISDNYDHNEQPFSNAYTTEYYRGRGFDRKVLVVYIDRYKDYTHAYNQWEQVSGDGVDVEIELGQEMDFPSDIDDPMILSTMILFEKV